MTVNSTSTRELTIDTIVLRALQLASLRSAQEGASGADWDAQRRMALDYLEIEVDSLQAEGVFARSVSFTDVTTVASTTTYELASTVLDVVGDGQYLESGQTTGSTLVRQISREQYMLISNKDAEGRPTQFYLERGATLTLYLWPVPSSAGTLTLQQHRKLGDNNDGSATLDLDPYWAKYITWALAHVLATAAGLPVQQCGYLRSEAQRMLKIAKSYAHQRPDVQMQIDHRSGWSNYG